MLDDIRGRLYLFWMDRDIQLIALSLRNNDQWIFVSHIDEASVEHAIRLCNGLSSDLIALTESALDPVFDLADLDVSQGELDMRLAHIVFVM